MVSWAKSRLGRSCKSTVISARFATRSLRTLTFRPALQASTVSMKHSRGYKDLP